MPRVVPAKVLDARTLQGIAPRPRVDLAERPALRGKATREDADALREEGIEFSSLPPFLSSDQH
jgi:hypothetical protein